MSEYVRSTRSSVTSAEGQALKKRAKGKETAFDPKKPKQLTIYTTKAFPAWQDKYIDLVRYVPTLRFLLPVWLCGKPELGD